MKFIMILFAIMFAFPTSASAQIGPPTYAKHCVNSWEGEIVRRYNTAPSCTSLFGERWWTEHLQVADTEDDFLRGRHLRVCTEAYTGVLRVRYNPIGTCQQVLGTNWRTEFYRADDAGDLMVCVNSWTGEPRVRYDTTRTCRQVFGDGWWTEHFYQQL